MQERQIRLVIIFVYSECSGTLQNSENALVRAAWLSYDDKLSSVKIIILKHSYCVFQIGSWHSSSASIYPHNLYVANNWHAGAGICNRIIRIVSSQNSVIQFDCNCWEQKLLKKWIIQAPFTWANRNRPIKFAIARHLNWSLRLYRSVLKYSAEGDGEIASSRSRKVQISAGSFQRFDLVVGTVSLDFKPAASKIRGFERLHCRRLHARSFLSLGSRNLSQAQDKQRKTDFQEHYQSSDKNFDCDLSKGMPFIRIQKPEKSWKLEVKKTEGNGRNGLRVSNSVLQGIS